MNGAKTGKRRHRVGDHRRIEAASSRLLPKSTQNSPFWAPNYEHVCLTTHGLYADSDLFTTLLKMTAPFQTLAREVNSAHRITRRATVKDDPSRVPPAHPRARMTLVSSQRLGGLKETMGVRRHLISRPTL